MAPPDLSPLPLSVPVPPSVSVSSSASPRSHFSPRRSSFSLGPASPSALASPRTGSASHSHSHAHAHSLSVSIPSAGSLSVPSLPSPSLQSIFSQAFHSAAFPRLLDQIQYPGARMSPALQLAAEAAKRSSAPEASLASAESGSPTRGSTNAENTANTTAPNASAPIDWRRLLISILENSPHRPITSNVLSSFESSSISGWRTWGKNQWRQYRENRHKEREKNQKAKLSSPLDSDAPGSSASPVQLDSNEQTLSVLMLNQVRIVKANKAIQRESEKYDRKFALYRATLEKEKEKEKKKMGKTGENEEYNGETPFLPPIRQNNRGNGAASGGSLFQRLTAGALGRTKATAAAGKSRAAPVSPEVQAELRTIYDVIVAQSREGYSKLTKNGLRNQLNQAVLANPANSPAPSAASFVPSASSSASQSQLDLLFDRVWLGMNSRNSMLLDQSDFISVIGICVGGTLEDQLAIMFELMDFDADGFIGLSDLFQALNCGIDYLVPEDFAHTATELMAQLNSEVLALQAGLSKSEFIRGMTKHGRPQLMEFFLRAFYNPHRKAAARVAAGNVKLLRSVSISGGNTGIDLVASNRIRYLAQPIELRSWSASTIHEAGESGDAIEERRDFHRRPSASQSNEPDYAAIVDGSSFVTVLRHYHSMTMPKGHFRRCIHAFLNSQLTINTASAHHNPASLSVPRGSPSQPSGARNSPVYHLLTGLLDSSSRSLIHEEFDRVTEFLWSRFEYHGHADLNSLFTMLNCLFSTDARVHCRFYFKLLDSDCDGALSVQDLCNIFEQSQSAILQADLKVLIDYFLARIEFFSGKKNKKYTANPLQFSSPKAGQRNEEKSIAVPSSAGDATNWSELAEIGRDLGLTITPDEFCDCVLNQVHVMYGVPQPRFPAFIKLFNGNHQTKQLNTRGTNRN